MAAAGVTFLVGLVAAAAASAWLWPRRPRAAVLAWAALVPFGLWLFWDHPGLAPAVLGMPVVFYAVRVNAARRFDPTIDRRSLLQYTLELMTPLPREEVEPPLAAALRRRAARGLLLLGVGIGLGLLGLWLEPWRVHPYLDDLWILAEAAIGFTGLYDLLTVAFWAGGRRHPDPHDASFVAATSLGVFWRRWNALVSRTLERGVFRPVLGATRGLGTRRALVLGVLATFTVSGLIHAVPLLVATSDRRLNLLLLGSTMLFFGLHGLAVLIEQAFPGRWREGWRGRAWVWSVWLGTAWLYPTPLAALLGVHGRPFASLSVVRLLGAGA